MEWEKWMSFTAWRREGKRHLKDALDNYRNLLGSWFLEYQSTRRNNQRTRAEANDRRVCRPTNRRETSSVARWYSLRHYRDLIMSSSFESLNLGSPAFSIPLALLPIAGVNIFEMSYLANQGFLLISHLRWRAIYLLSCRARTTFQKHTPTFLSDSWFQTRKSGNRMRRKGWQTSFLTATGRKRKR